MQDRHAEAERTHKPFARLQLQQLIAIQPIKHAKVVGFADLGMEAIYEFDVVDMELAVDSGSTSAHSTGPAEWQERAAARKYNGLRWLRGDTIACKFIFAPMTREILRIWCKLFKIMDL